MPEDIMYCGNCKEELGVTADKCPKCGSDPKKAVNYCIHCGEPVSGEIPDLCVKCGTPFSSSVTPGKGSLPEISPALAAIISLIIPGLGLFLAYPEEKKQKALLIMAGLLFMDLMLLLIGLLLIVFFIGACIWLFIPLLHIGAAIYTYLGTGGLKTKQEMQRP